MIDSQQDNKVQIASAENGKLLNSATTTITQNKNPNPYWRDWVTMLSFPLVFFVWPVYIYIIWILPTWNNRIKLLASSYVFIFVILSPYLEWSLGIDANHILNNNLAYYSPMTRLLYYLFSNVSNQIFALISSRGYFLLMMSLFAALTTLFILIRSRLDKNVKQIFFTAMLSLFASSFIFFGYIGLFLLHIAAGD